MKELDADRPIFLQVAEHDLYLLDARGERAANSFGVGYQAENGTWKVQRVFNRPAAAGALQMVVPALGRYEECAVSLTPQDLGRVIEFGGHQVQLHEWRQQRERLLLTLGWPADGLTQALQEWTATLSDGTVIEVPAWRQQEWRGLDKATGQYVVVYYLEHAPGALPAAVLARKAQRVVEGNWMIDLPDPAN